MFEQLLVYADDNLLGVNTNTKKRKGKKQKFYSPLPKGQSRHKPTKT
jgi:hypothetical protein